MSAPDVTGFEGQDVATLIDERAARRGDHPFLVWEPFEGKSERWSYAAFGDAVRRFAAGLQARAVGVGDTVLIHLDNRPEFLLAWLGCAYAGAVAVTTNTRSTADEIAYYAGHARVVGAITEHAYADAVRAALPPGAWLTIVGVTDGATAFAALTGDDVASRPSFARMNSRLRTDCIGIRGDVRRCCGTKALRTLNI